MVLVVCAPLALKTPQMFCCPATSPVDPGRAGRSFAGGWGAELEAVQWDWQILCWMSWEMGKFHLGAAGGWRESLCAASQCCGAGSGCQCGQSHSSFTAAEADAAQCLQLGSAVFGALLGLLKQ